MFIDSRARHDPADRTYWSEQLDGAPNPAELSAFPAVRTVLPPPRQGGFPRLARSGGGAAAVVLAGLAVHGQRCGGGSDLVVAYHVDSTLIPVRVQLESDLSFAQMVRAVGIALRRARRHPFVPESDDPWPDRASRSWPLSAEHTDGRWYVEIPGSAAEFVRLFERLVAEPDHPTGDIAAAGSVPAAAPSTVHEASGGATTATLLTAFADRVRRTPAATALRTAGETVSYAELDARANRWAHWLIRAGAGPETVVATAAPRSVEAIVALYAIMKTGAAFLLLDPEMPAVRRDRMLDTARPLPLPQLARPGEPPARALGTDRLAELDRLSAGEPATAPVTTVRGDGLAYVMFTSGSSGHPKGVGITHTAIRHHLDWMQERFDLDDTDVLLHKTPVTFDASLWEVLWPLQAGATLVLPDPAAPLEPGELAALFRHFAVTTAHFAPSLLRSFLDIHGGPPEVRRVLVGGEAFPPDLAQRCAAGTGEVTNLYGPTEACIAVSAHRVRPTDTATVPIGEPATGYRILDSALCPVDDGVTGELYIAGVQLARGYLNRPGETATRFVADPGDPHGSRLYRTGDTVRRGHGGELEYVGRSDLQVSIHGVRMEPAEIEAALTADDTVAAAVVIADDNRLHGYLVAATGRTIDPDAVRKSLVDRLPGPLRPHTLTVLESLPLTPAGKTDRRALPAPAPETTAYRVPDDPVTETLAGVYAEILGREQVGAHDSFFALGGDSIMSILLVSRAASHGIAITAQQVFEHRTPTALAAAAQGTAAVPVLTELPGGGVGEMPLPPAASFLVERGGAWRRFAQTLALELPPGITAAQLSATLSAVLERHDMLRSRLYRDAGGRWRLFADTAGSVQAADLVHRVAIDPGLGEQARTALAAAALDTALGELDPAEGAVVRFVWLDPTDDRAAATGRLLVVVHHIAIDGVSWRILVPDLIAAWAQVAAGRTPALPAVTTSMRRWSHALEEESRRPGRTAELEYWRDIVRDDDPPLADRPWDPVRDLASNVHYTTLELAEAETTALISTVAQRYHTGAQEVLLTALVLAVASWRPRDRVLVRLEGHGREPSIAPGADISRTVGWFTALYPARFRLDGIDIADAVAGGASLATAVKAVKEQLRAVPDHGIGYGLLRYTNPATAGSLPRTEPGQIVFNYLGNVAAAVVPSELAGLGWLPASDLAELPRTPDPDMPAGGALELDIIVVSGRLRATIGYPQSLLDRGAGTEFVERYAAILHVLATHAETAAGGHTPSDFPLVPIGQSDVERWEQRYPGLADIWPMGPMQAEFLSHGRSSGLPVDPYVVQLVVTLAGALDTGRLRAAAEAVLAAHPVLRTAFRAGAAETPVAVVVAEVALPWSEVEVEPDTDIEPLLAADRRARFDFARPPLIRFTLLRSGTEQARLVVTSHHIVVDGWSVPILVRELLGHYSGIRELLAAAPSRASYRDYLEWLRHTDRTAAEAAWGAALAAAVPTTIADPPGCGSVPVEERLDLDEVTGRRIAATAADIGVTVNTLVQVAWALVLGEHTGDRDIVFGATVSGRPAELPGVETMVGLLIGTVPVRVRFDPAEPAAALLTRVQQEQAALAPHHHLGPAAIRACAPGTVQELFDTVLFFESYPADPGPAVAAAIDGLTITGFEWYEATHYPLALWIWPGHRAGDRIRIVAAYWPDRLAADTVRTLLERFRETLTALGARPGAPVGTYASPVDDAARAR